MMTEDVVRHKFFAWAYEHTGDTSAIEAAAVRLINRIKNFVRGFKDIHGVFQTGDTFYVVNYDPVSEEYADILTGVTWACDDGFLMGSVTLKYDDQI